MDGSFNDPGFNYYGGAEGGLYYAQEFRLSKVVSPQSFVFSFPGLFGPTSIPHMNFAHPAYNLRAVGNSAVLTVKRMYFL